MKNKGKGKANKEENLSIREQMQALYRFFGYKDNIIWDCYQRDQKIHVRNKVALVFGVSKKTAEESEKDADDAIEEEDTLLEESDAKSKNEVKNQVREEKKLNKRIDDITEAIWRQAKYTDGVLMMSIVYLAIITPSEEVQLHAIEDPEEEKNYIMYPLFRIMKCVKDKSTRHCCMIFVDDHARVYSNWRDFKLTTMLPDSIIVAPTEGIYNCDEEGSVLLEVFSSPASSLAFKILSGIDRAADIVGILAAVAALVAIGLIAGVPLAASISVVIFTVASIVSAVASAWTATRSATKLVDRKRHERPNTLDDKEARSCWLGAVGGATGLAAGLTGTGMTEMIRNGQPIPTIMRITVDTVMIANIIMQKLSLVNDYFDVMYKVREKNVSALDFIRLAASIAVFVHSVNNFKIAKKAIKSNQQSTISAFREMLSTDQQKIFDHMAKETIRRRGESAGNCDIIRSLRNNPLARENIESRVKLNSLMRQQNWKDTSAYTANVLKNFKNSLHDDDLEGTVVSIQDKVSERSFELLKDLVESYVEIHGNRIEHELNRFIPIEEFMSSIFTILYIEALKLEMTVDEYILETQLMDRLYLFLQISKFYSLFRMQSPNELCMQCGGKFYVLHEDRPIINCKTCR
ncbi:uncharacterized protein LOC132259127 [Phlebotomus argentipes]|uniref:uncharacterized protein LOC132259127 n=1 Tax=Phlebotomus argentipes TaxID=94469 RepID=UPI0028937BC9|nr:uncharacterized protein LOC132259127 [Phlebotomus argentipes]